MLVLLYCTTELSSNNRWFSLCISVSGQPIADFTACVVGSLILGGAVAVVIYFICCLINRPVESNENESNNAIPLREESD